MAWLIDRIRRRLRGSGRVERALEAIRDDPTIEGRRRLYEALLRADLAVITTTDHGPPPREALHGEIRFQGTVIADGGVMLQAFTNAEAMRALNLGSADGVAIASSDLLVLPRERRDNPGRESGHRHERGAGPGGSVRAGRRPDSIERRSRIALDSDAVRNEGEDRPAGLRGPADRLRTCCTCCLWRSRRGREGLRVRTRTAG